MRLFKLILLILTIGTLIYSPCWASGLELRKIVVTGYGFSESTAILNGIEEAIKEEYGFFLSEEKFSTSVTGEIQGKFISTSALKREIYQKFKGTVDRHKVLSIIKDPDTGNYKAKLIVYVVRYKAPGISINQRRRIAVYPFEATDESVKTLLTQAIVTYLTQSRKFSVLDRENYKYYKEEKAVITSPDADKRERAKLKHLAGTDYILLGKVDLFSVRPSETGSKFLGLTSTGYTVNYNVSYRVLMFSTGQIKYSNEQTGSIFVPNENERLAKKKAINRIAKDIVSDLLLDIYPPVVIAVENNLAVVNIGNRLVSEGDCFDIYKKGEKLIDPYTHEVLGYDEIKTGRLIIVGVKPKFSQGKLIEGYVVRGSILRPCKIIRKRRFGSSTIKMLPNGGVVLPGDKK